MRVKKAIRKIAALGAGATMLGATVLGAMAADLSNYPNPLFIKDGVFDAVLVVGDNAAAEDVVGVTNIAIAMQAASVKKTPVDTGAGSTTVVQGDAAQIKESTDYVEFNETLSSVKTSVTKTDIKALADANTGSALNTASVSQVINLPNSTRVMWELWTDVSDKPQAYLKVDGSSLGYEYKATFTPAWKSDHTTANSGELKNFENKKITLLGKEYTITDTDHSTTNNVALTLMGGAGTFTQKEGTSKTITVNGVEYAVTVDAVASGPKAYFTVNGESTGDLEEGETYLLKDGSELGVTNMIYYGYASEIGNQVTFTVGAKKVKLTDANTSNNNYGGSLEVGTNTVDAVGVDIITGTDAGTTEGADVTISEIRVKYTPSTTLYITPGTTMDAAATKEEGESGNFFLSAFDIDYKGMDYGKTEEISLSGSDNYYKLKWTNKLGGTANAEIFSINGTGVVLGYYSSPVRDLVLNETEPIADEEYLVVSKNEYSHILQYRGIDISNTQAKFDDENNAGVTYVGTYTGTTGTVTIDGNSYTFVVPSSPTATSSLTSFDMNGDGDYGDVAGDSCYGATDDLADGLYTQYGACIAFNTTAENKFSVTSNQMDDGSTRVTWRSGNVYVSSNELQYNTTSPTQGSEIYSYAQLGDSTLYEAADKYGTIYQENRPTSGQNSLKITFPKQQAMGLVYVTAGDTTTSTGTSGVNTDDVQEIGLGAVKLASEIANVKAQNAIVVGGPCVNPAAATLLDNPADCASGFTEGKAKIKLFQNGDYVAMLVAGYSAADTRRATNVASDYASYKDQLTGDEVEVTGTSLTDITVGKPTVTG
ncbi:hypothetical protein HYW21_07165 [Candidatus Woesearchaeota archaeon]|nr:hypothetical protein [Candidatus Woesearchaeota archaeon]